MVLSKVGVFTNQETTGEGIVLKDDLMDDTRAWLPETDVVLGARCGQEVVDLPVDLVGASQVLLAANLGFDKMVAMYSRGSGHRGHAGRHKLQDSHLSSSILASDAIRAKLKVARAALDVLAMGVVEMRVEDLLGESERAIETLAHNAQVLAHLLVVDVMALLPVGHLDLLGEWSIADGSQLPPCDKALADTA